MSHIHEQARVRATTKQLLRAKKMLESSDKDLLPRDDRSGKWTQFWSLHGMLLHSAKREHKKIGAILNLVLKIIAPVYTAIG